MSRNTFSMINDNLHIRRRTKIVDKIRELYPLRQTVSRSTGSIHLNYTYGRNPEMIKSINRLWKYNSFCKGNNIEQLDRNCVTPRGIELGRSLSYIKISYGCFNIRMHSAPTLFTHTLVSTISPITLNFILISR